MKKPAELDIATGKVETVEDKRKRTMKKVFVWTLLYCAIAVVTHYALVTHAINLRQMDRYYIGKYIDNKGNVKFGELRYDYINNPATSECSNLQGNKH